MMDDVSKINEVYQRWAESIKIGRWSDALSVIDQSLAEIPHQAASEMQKASQAYLFFMKAETYTQSKQWRLAIKWDVRALKIDRENPSVWLSLGRVLQEIGKHKWAINCFQKVEEIDPQLDVLRQWTEMIDSGRSLEALAILDQAFELSQVDADSTIYWQARLLFMKSVTYRQLGQWRLSIKSCIESLRFNPQNVSAWKGLGKALLEVGKPRWAAQCFHKAQSLDT